MDVPHIEITYDQNANIVTVDYDECLDPCDGLTEEECATEKCLKNCLETHINTEIPNLDAYAECIQHCGEYVPDPLAARPVSYDYTFIAAWNAIPFHPIDEEDNWVVFEGSGVPNEYGEIVIPEFTLPDPWPEIHTGNNTCYAIGIGVNYDDGTRCVFIEWNCNIVG